MAACSNPHLEAATYFLGAAAAGSQGPVTRGSSQVAARKLVGFWAQATALCHSSSATFPPFCCFLSSRYLSTYLSAGLASSQVDALSRPFPCLCHCPWVWFAFLSFELSGIGEEEGRRPFNPLGHLVDTKVDYRRKKTRERPNCSKERADEEGKNERTVGKSTKKTSTREQKRPKKVQQTRLPGTGSRHTAKVSS